MLFLVFPDLKIISSFALSPAASSVLSSGALVHPQPGFTLKILSVSPPTFLIQKTWDTWLFCGVRPKSQKISENETLGGPVFPPGEQKSVKTTITTASDRTIPAHRSLRVFPPGFSCSLEFPAFLWALDTCSSPAKRVRSGLVSGRADTLGLRLVCGTDHAHVAFSES